MTVPHTGEILRYNVGVIADTAVDSARKRYSEMPLSALENFTEFFSDSDPEVLTTYCIAAFFMDSGNSAAHGIMVKAVRDVYDDLAAAIVTRL